MKNCATFKFVVVINNLRQWEEIRIENWKNISQTSTVTMTMLTVLFIYACTLFLPLICVQYSICIRGQALYRPSTVANLKMGKYCLTARPLKRVKV
jgi:hypothetical protein